MDYKFAGDFTKAPLGPFTKANKLLVWPGLTEDFDSNGTKFEIVEDPRFPAGRACRMLYPQGEFGMQNQSYQIRVKSPRTIANLEWLWLWEEGFVFANDPAKNHGGGKVGPCINWGEIGGDNAKRGTRAMFWWNCNGSNYAHPCYNPSLQDQRSGGQLVQPVVYVKPPIVTEQIYKFRIQMMGGPDGWVKYWVDEVQVAAVMGKALQVTAEDDVIFDFAYFAGGASDIYAPTHDCYGRHGGIRYWSGEASWEGNGNTDTGGDDGGAVPGPTPPTGGVTITLGDELYKVTGDLILTKLD